jgi:hypothetical protein
MNLKEIGYNVESGDSEVPGSIPGAIRFSE